MNHLSKCLILAFWAHSGLKTLVYGLNGDIPHSAASALVMIGLAYLIQLQFNKKQEDSE